MECLSTHSFEDDARECCLPQVREVFVCQDCFTEHNEQADAEACCVDGDAVSTHRLPIPTTAQLEAMGQLRLVP
jgi:hypothetical protein